MDYLANKLYEIPRNEWPEIGGVILSEQWPDRLAQKPERWDELDWQSREEMLAGVLAGIERECGMKMLRRHQMIKSHGWNDAEFDDWWEFQSRTSDLWWILQSTLGEQAPEKPSQRGSDERRKKLEDSIFPALGAFIGCFLSILLSNLLHLI